MKVRMLSLPMALLASALFAILSGLSGLSNLAIANSAEDEVLKRIRPIGHVNTIKPIETVKAAAVAAPPAEDKTPEPVEVAAVEPVAATAPDGKKIYDSFCFACHATGAANAPKLGDKEAWAPRIAQGKDALIHSALNGKIPAMPPRGTCMSCTDEDLKAVVEYMISQGQ